MASPLQHRLESKIRALPMKPPASRRPGLPRLVEYKPGMYRSSHNPPALHGEILVLEHGTLFLLPVGRLASCWD